MRSSLIVILYLLVNAIVLSNELDWQEALDVKLDKGDYIYVSNMDDNYLYLYSLYGIFFKIDKSNLQIVNTENFYMYIAGAFKLNDRLNISLYNLFHNTVYYKSSDDFGEQWYDYNPTFGSSASPVVLDGFAANENEIFLCGSSLQKRAFFGYSNDGGASYATVFNESEANYTIYKDVSTNTLFMGSSSGLYTSSDNGINWLKHDYFDASNSGGVRSLNYHNNTLFATDDKNNVFRSFDIGKTWVKSTLPEKGISWFLGIIKYEHLLLMPGRNERTAKAILYFSYNNGETWSKVFDMHGIASNAFIMNDSIYVVVNTGKIYKSSLQPLSISENQDEQKQDEQKQDIIKLLSTKTIVLDFDLTHDLSISVSDQNGRTIERECAKITSYSPLTIELCESLSNGVYSINLFNEKKSYKIVTLVVD